MNVEELFRNITKLHREKNQNLTPKFELVEISYGDRYWNEQGQEFIFNICDKEYRVGYSHITEDGDDWAQAECHFQSWSRCDGKCIKAEVIWDLIQNYGEESRDHILEKILSN